jgi:hypothetical protein
MFIALSVIVLFGCSHNIFAQQRDGEETNTATSSAPPSRTVNFNIIQLLNGEYLEMFGTGTTRGLLRGHPSVAGVELGTTSADPLIFSTNSIERMKIGANGFVGIGITNPAAPFEMYVPDGNPYSPTNTSGARMRLINSTTTNTNGFEIDLGAMDSNGVPSSGVRLVGMLTNKTPGLTSGDFAIGLRAGGVLFENTRFTSAGNVGIGTSTPAYKLDVAGPIRSTSGGFIFPDGTVQTTAGGGGGGGSQWVTSGTNIYYNGGNVGLGTSTPGVALDVSQGRAIRVGNANLSSGGDYVHLGNHAWYNGAAWQLDGSPGALYQMNGQTHAWYAHNGAGSFTPWMFLVGGNLGIGTTNPSARLHVDGGTIRLASTAGQIPFQLYSYQNSDSLWLTSGNATKAEINLSTSYAVDYDRSIALQYIPGTTGALAGILNIGQIGKNNASYTHGATALYTNGLERLRVNAAGNVGIGTPSPAFRLDVQGGAVNGAGGLCIAGDCKTAWSQVGGGTSSQWTTSGANIFYAAGSVGINNSAPNAKLHVNGVGIWGTAVFGGTAVSSHFNYNGDNTEDTYIRGGKTTSRVIVNDANSGHVLIANGGGNVGIGTASPTEKLEVLGNIKVSGNINAKYQDVAEWVESSQELAGGTVVILDSSKSNHVIASTQSYDSRVAGVISLQPGLTLGEEAEGRVLVATSGRVKVKVDATNGPIQIGDLLVTSSREGFAMKSSPIEIGGARIHRPGTLIGKALEPLASGSGEILVLLSLQ